MTSFAFILGVLPLVFATGAGKEMRRTLGTAVFSGMIGVTAVGVFLTPVFFAVVERLSESGFFRSPRVRAWERAFWDAVKFRWLIRRVSSVARARARTLTPIPSSAKPGEGSKISNRH